jgi:pSer/pThr/pTyr-binding forkhead associated (FHA) protein
MNLQLFEGIPEKSTTHCSSYASAVLALPDNDTNTIEIGKSSQVISNRNALVVGRQASSCDIRITHKSLSRQHALLYYYLNCNSSTSTSSASTSTTSTKTKTIQQRPDLYVFDLETKSGTFLNQKKINSKTPVRLRNGDTVQFGKARPILTVRWEEKESKNDDDDDDDDDDNNNNNNKICDDDMRKTTKTTTTSTTTTINSEAPEGEADRHNESENVNLEKETEEKEEEEDQYAGLTGRAKRQAEIAAMMSSLEQKPTYTKFVPSSTEENQTILSSTGEKISSSTTISASHNNQLCPPHKKKVLEKYRLPLTECTDMAVLESSAISCAVMDPTGARFAIASMDSSLKLYDFAGYNLLDPVPFFNGIVEDGYPILSMAYSSDGSSILIGTGSSQCKVFDRDGQELVKFVRGDVYVRDPSKTIGHTAAVTSVGWHPLHKSIVFTTSRDGSMRSWNINKGKFSFGMLNCSDVVVIKHLRTGRKTIPTCLAVSTNTLAIGTECGSIQIYKYPLVSKLRPQQSVQASPAQLGSKDGYSIVSLVYSVDETKLAVRTKKEVTVWNTASRLSTSTPPWMKFVNLPLHDDDVNSSTPTMAFSPNGKVLCIATSTRDENNSRIVRSSLEICIIPKEAQNLENNIPPSPIYSLPVLDTDTGHSILSLFWHQKLNQILVTTPKGFQIWYSTDWSKKGILLTSSRRRKRKNVEDELQDIYKSRAPPPGTAIRHEEIITPNSLPLFSTDKPRGSKKQRSEEEHRESVAQRIPQKPSKDIYNTSDIMFKQMISDGNSSKQKIIAGKDPREALAEYNEGKSYIGQAYEGNIERILTTKTIEQEMDEMNNKKK